MRDYGALIESLERKAADPAVTDHERDALLAKAAELRVAYGANPPRKPPTRPTIATASGPGWHYGATTSTSGTASVTYTTTFR